MLLSMLRKDVIMDIPLLRENFLVKKYLIPLKILQGFLLFLPTTFPFAGRAYPWIPFFVVSIVAFGIKIEKCDKYFLLFLCYIFSLSLIKVIFFETLSFYSASEILTYFKKSGFLEAILFFLIYFSAKKLDSIALYALLFLLGLECLIAFYQIMVGVRFSFAGQIPLGEEYVKQTIEPGLTLWYQIRPMGLSLGSSMMGYKSLVFFILLLILPMRRYFLYSLFLLSSLFLIVEFKRGSIFAVFAFIAVYFISRANKFIYKKSFLIIFSIVIFCTYFYWDTISFQLLRGNNLKNISLEKELGRLEFWRESIEYIQTHILLGNYASVYTYAEGGSFAINSYLTFWVRNGLVGLILLGLVVFQKLKQNSDRILLTTPFLAASVFNDFSLIGNVIEDVVLFYILIQDVKLFPLKNSNMDLKNLFYKIQDKLVWRVKVIP